MENGITEILNFVHNFVSNMLNWEIAQRSARENLLSLIPLCRHSLKDRNERKDIVI